MKHDGHLAACWLGHFLPLPRGLLSSMRQDQAYPHAGLRVSSTAREGNPQSTGGFQAFASITVVLAETKFKGRKTRLHLWMGGAAKSHCRDAYRTGGSGGGTGKGAVGRGGGREAWGAFMAILQSAPLPLTCSASGLLCPSRSIPLLLQEGGTSSMARDWEMNRPRRHTCRPSKGVYWEGAPRRRAAGQGNPGEWLCPVRPQVFWKWGSFKRGCLWPSRLAWPALGLGPGSFLVARVGSWSSPPSYGPLQNSLP